jgi:hypothetical protein
MVENLRAAGNKIQMTVGQRIEGARVDGFDSLQVYCRRTGAFTASAA